MGFSGISIWEILVVLVVALLVLGPNRLPEIARKMGQAMRAIRKASADLTTTVSRELNATQIDSSPSQTKEPKKDTTPSQSEDNAPEKGEKPENPGGASAEK